MEVRYQLRHSPAMCGEPYQNPAGLRSLANH